ncbi:MAG: dihydrolipoyl dehydrogenase [Deltaproteobacteria bacterium]|nr:dihydrolipoyl dehydrogenase [Deltaproteobacteria bacterium]
MNSTHDLIVIGGGPGGYVAAIRAAKLGLRTACVERERLGGVCLNWGCIPTKALLRSAEVFALCQKASEFGIKIEGQVTFDFATIMARARKVVDAQERGIKFLLGKNKVDHVVGAARLGGAGKVMVSGPGGETTLRAEHVIIATGARARGLPGIELDGERIIDYRGALSMKALPKSLVVVGAGAIGVEFACFVRTLGVDVTVVEYMPALVPVEDTEISDALAREFKKQGIKLHLGMKVASVRVAGSEVVVVTEAREDLPGVEGQKTETLTAERVLLAVGVTGNVEGLGLAALGVRTDHGFISVDDVTYATSAKGIYAVGDVTGPPALAHVASAEGVACVERVAGLSPPPIDYDSIPAATFTRPEIGSIGLTERKANELKLSFKVGRFPFRALGKARAAGEADGFVKVLHAADDGRLLGAHIVGHNASDLIAEYGLAKSTEANAQSLIHTVHAHPTLAEALKEASEDAYGQAIHI